MAFRPVSFGHDALADGNTRFVQRQTPVFPFLENDLGKGVDLGFCDVNLEVLLRRPRR